MITYRPISSHLYIYFSIYFLFDDDIQGSGQGRNLSAVDVQGLAIQRLKATKTSSTSRWVQISCFGGSPGPLTLVGISEMRKIRCRDLCSLRSRRNEHGLIQYIRWMKFSYYQWKNAVTSLATFSTLGAF